VPVAYPGDVPRLVPPVVPAGHLRETDQPTFRKVSDLTLRPWETSDAPDLLRAFSDPQIQYWHMRGLASEGEAAEWIASWSGRWDAETDGSWAVINTRSGDLLGQIALRSLNLEFGHGQITYWVLPHARNQGVATLAASELSRWALQDLGLHRLTINHSSANEASCHVALKAGFALEGIQRSALLHDDGWHDMHLHAQVRDTRFD
jgi:ribosomal-protein-alanine N-acetyltransferase